MIKNLGSWELYPTTVMIRFFLFTSFCFISPFMIFCSVRIFEIFSIPVVDVIKVFLDEI